MTEERLIEIIDSLCSEIGLPKEDLFELYDTFIEEMTDEMFRIKIAYQKGDFEDLKNISHNIKGVCANMKFEEMFVEAKALNDKMKAEDFEDLYPHIEKMNAAFNGFKNAFIAYYNR